MSDVQKKIDEIEAEMARTQKNKATNYHIGTLKAKLAKLRSELINGPGGKSAGKFIWVIYSCLHLYMNLYSNNF